MSHGSLWATGTFWLFRCKTEAHSTLAQPALLRPCPSTPPPPPPPPHTHTRTHMCAHTYMHAHTSPPHILRFHLHPACSSLSGESLPHRTSGEDSRRPSLTAPFPLKTCCPGVRKERQLCPPTAAWELPGSWVPAGDPTCPWLSRLSGEEASGGPCRTEGQRADTSESITPHPRRGNLASVAARAPSCPEGQALCAEKGTCVHR